MNVKEVPTDHDFFDPAYIKHWSESIIRYRPERKKTFKAFAAEAARIGKPGLAVFELGSGPGFLAEALLENCDIARYALVDFSPEMLQLSGSHLAQFRDRAVFLQLDFRKNNWTASLPANFDLIVSLQAVHALRHASRIPKLYGQLYGLVAPGGKILICDHINAPSGSSRGSFHDGQRAPSDVRASWFYQRERNLPRRRPQPDGSRKIVDRRIAARTSASLPANKSTPRVRPDVCVVVCN